MGCASIIPTGCTIPQQYFAEAAGQGARGPDATLLTLYLLVEKITASFERLPQTWPVHGTTGYNFTNVVNGLFVDSRAKARARPRLPLVHRRLRSNGPMSRTTRRCSCCARRSRRS